MLQLGSTDPSTSFSILRKLGQGTFGSVWLAAERQSGKVVAIKVLPMAPARVKQGAPQQKWLTDLRREIQILRLAGDCPALIRFHGSFVTPLLEAVWIIMEACECSALDYMQTVGKPFAEDAVRAVLGGCLRGLVHLHEEYKIIHRDVKASKLTNTHLSSVCVQIQRDRHRFDRSRLSTAAKLPEPCMIAVGDAVCTR